MNFKLFSYPPGLIGRGPAWSVNCVRTTTTERHLTPKRPSAEMISQQHKQDSEQGTSQSESADRDSRGWRLVKTWDFGLLWWGQVTSLWFVYELTGSALMIAMVGLLQTIPPLVFGPIIGVYLDRLQKKTVMVWVDLIRTMMTFLIPALYGLGLLRLDGLFILIFLTSMVSTVFGPALVSAVPLLV